MITQMSQKILERRQSFAAVFTNITRRGALSEEDQIHITKMTAIKIALKEIHKREDKRWVLYTNSQSFMHSHKIQQRKSPRISNTR